MTEGLSLKERVRAVTASIYGIRETGQVLPVPLIRPRPPRYLQGHTQTTTTNKGEEHRAGPTEAGSHRIVITVFHIT